MSTQRKPDKFQPASTSAIGSLDYLKSLEAPCALDKVQGKDKVHGNSSLVATLDTHFMKRSEDPNVTALSMQQSSARKQRVLQAKTLILIDLTMLGITHQSHEAFNICSLIKKPT